MEIRVIAGNYQDLFLACQSKFPCLKAGIGSGKTLLMLVKVYEYCERYPGTTALVVRKTYSDLKDSTMKDFQNYFQCVIGGDKNYSFPNRSQIFFRHGDELQVLKNLNLGIAAIEQAEEFENDQQFQFIRDRLRQQNGATVRPLIVIANANGHNWVYNLWMADAERKEIDASTGQFHFKQGAYECFTASTFANEKNLPPDFIADCRAKEIEAPNHFKQFILNDDDVTQEDDLCFTFQELEKSRTLECPNHSGGTIILSVDVARYGSDKCAAVAIQQVSQTAWKQIFLETWEKKDLMESTGRIRSISANLNADVTIIDEQGLGAGVLDALNAGSRSMEESYKGFSNKPYSYEENKFYANARTHMAFKLKDLLSKNYMIGLSEEICQSLLTLRYTHRPDGRRILVSKEKMRSFGVKSPDEADSLLMALSLTQDITQKQNQRYRPLQPAFSKEESLFRYQNEDPSVYFG